MNRGTGLVSLPLHKDRFPSSGDNAVAGGTSVRACSASRRARIASLRSKRDHPGSRPSVRRGAGAAPDFDARAFWSRKLPWDRNGVNADEVADFDPRALRMTGGRCRRNSVTFGPLAGTKASAPSGGQQHEHSHLVTQAPPRQCVCRASGTLAVSLQLRRQDAGLDLDFSGSWMATRLSGSEQRPPIAAGCKPVCVGSR